MKISKEVKIGITGVIALVLLFICINFLKGINLFKSTDTYYISFKNVTGLAVSSQVYADGYEVGIVHAIDYDYENPGNIIVNIEVDKNMRIPKGSYATLETAMLGGATLNILMANNPTQRYMPGDTISSELDNGLMAQAAQLMPKVESMLVKLDSILDNLNRLTASPELQEILHNTADITANLKHSTESLNTLLDKDVPQLTHRFDRIGNNVEVLTDSLKDLHLQETMASVNRTLRNVEEVTGKLNSTDNTMGLLLNDSSLYRNMSNTMGSANELLINFREKPSRYVHFSIFGKKDK
jgi:phospholipid/cholesterol/gamma-HCH transport system substrate-binding protein